MLRSRQLHARQEVRYVPADPGHYKCIKLRKQVEAAVRNAAYQLRKKVDEDVERRSDDPRGSNRSTAILERSKSNSRKKKNRGGQRKGKSRKAKPTDS